MVADPAVHPLLQQVEGQGPGAQQLVMKCTDIEVLAEFDFGAAAQLQDLELPDLVRKRLARPENVAVDLVDDVVLGLCGVVLEECDAVRRKRSLGLRIADLAIAVGQSERGIPESSATGMRLL